LGKKRAQPALIAVDLGIDRDDGDELRSAKRWPPRRRRSKPDFCSLFAAAGLRELEAYLAKWAAYQDYLARE
jgi:hypothetical protein